MAWPKWIILPYLLLSYSVPGDCKNTNPSIEVSSSFSYAQDIRAAPRVPVDHVFFENHQKNFSWNDDALQERLWHGRRLKETQDAGLIKRAMTKVIGGVVFRLPSCLGCMKAAMLGEYASLTTLTQVFLQAQILIPQPQLQDRCVFYTGVQDLTDKLKRLLLPGITAHPNLSKLASDWACSSPSSSGNGQKITIWNLYSGANDVTGAGESISQYNFWEVYTPGSWLSPLLEQPPNPPKAQFTYFGRMSNSMAQVCGGKIYVATLDPQNLAKYQFIWRNDEWPTLLARYKIGGVYAPTELIAVDISNPSKQYSIDFETLASTGTVTPTKRDDMTEEEEKLYKRDNCDTNVAYEPSDEDWFGVGGKIGPLGFGLGN